MGGGVKFNPYLEGTAGMGIKIAAADDDETESETHRDSDETESDGGDEMMSNIIIVKTPQKVALRR